MQVEVGSILEAKVTGITKFGAFVKFENDQTAMVHISEIANTFVEDVHDHLQTGQAVKVLVLSAENGRVNLSIKKALPQQERRAPRSPRPAPGPQGGPRSAAASGSVPPQFQGRGRPEPLPPSGDQAFEDKLKRFLSSSEGKMADLNRSMDGKRGRRRR